MAEIYKNFSPDLYEVTYSVEEEDSEQRLDQFVAQFLSSFSREQIKQKIKKGEILILGRPSPHRPSVKVHYGEHVYIMTPRGDLEDEYWNGQKLKLELDPPVIYEDDHLIAISKPAYMTTHPTGRHLFNCATVYFENKYGHTIHSIHRLDRETSGVQLLAKNPKSAQQMTTYFEEDMVSKCYFFMAHKNKINQYPLIAKERMGQLDNYIPRLYVHCFPENSKEGKHAQTTLAKLYEDDNFFLGLAFPKTGRQHQIRAHAAYHGLPLIGDKLYNGDPRIFMRFKDGVATREDHLKMQLSRHALHAIALKLPYPTKNNEKIFRAPLPQDFIDWMKNHLQNINLDELNLKIDALIKDVFKMV